MTSVVVKPDTFGNLKDKVVVIIGGTTGIGAVAVTELLSAGAKVVLGDVKTSDPAFTNDNFTFVYTDVSKYTCVVNLFATAFGLHARIDHAVCNAGIIESGQLFATGDSDDSIREPPPTAVLDVNLKGAIFFARVAVHYMRRSLAQNASTQKDSSILLVSSVAGFGNWPGLFQYSASKHGVMGLFHSTKDFLYGTENIRVNVILPNMTDTQMVTGVIAAYKANGIPTNDPKHVVNAFLHSLSTNTTGVALYVSGGKIFEIEKRLDDVKAQWLGQDLNDELQAGQHALGAGRNWTKGKSA
ncbi:hypothetical protein BDU57DRAFT_518523 [Ampelomyces quisqualis]|uniref:NAD(P)-binding protein n=1 Tax=Ampelomyces quisqualis TaxID=50730 RepID=A0A6A5QJB5_AMPQU|nr:hypothetical protein BDU57DRAFT_518523 [Ampelomyces quisqualis]